MRIDEVINDVEKLTVGEFFDILKRVKVKILISIFISLATLGYGIFKAGQYCQIRDTAVAIGYPFTMSVKKEIIYQILRNDPSEVVRLGELNLAKNPGYPRSKDGIGLILHRIDDKDASDIEQIGSVVAQKCRFASFFSLLFSKLGSMGTVYADARSFDWHGHQGNRRFREEYVKGDTVRRYYDDGWILQYKLDSRGRSIPSSFTWIRRR